MEYSQLIRCSLQHAADSGDPALLRQVFDTIAGSLHRVTSSAGTEALVICAEASLKVPTDKAFALDALPVLFRTPTAHVRV